MDLIGLLDEGDSWETGLSEALDSEKPVLLRDDGSIYKLEGHRDLLELQLRDCDLYIGVIGQ